MKRIYEIEARYLLRPDSFTLTVTGRDGERNVHAMDPEPSEEDISMGKISVSEHMSFDEARDAAIEHVRTERESVTLFQHGSTTDPLDDDTRISFMPREKFKDFQERLRNAPIETVTPRYLYCKPLLSIRVGSFDGSEIDRREAAGRGGSAGDSGTNPLW